MSSDTGKFHKPKNLTCPAAAVCDSEKHVKSTPMLDFFRQLWYTDLESPSAASVCGTALTVSCRSAERYSYRRKEFSMNKHTKRLAAAAVSVLAAALTTVCGTATASASGSVQDVYDAMRRIGMPESIIQDAKTQFQNTEHDANGMTVNGHYYTYDVWADLVEINQDQIWNEVAKQFDLSGDDLKQSYQTATAPTGTTADTGKQSGTTTTKVTTYITTTKPSVTTDKPFTKMTLDEKKAYVKSLPESERAAFIAGLSNTERNSIIKQMDPASQANVMQGFINVGEQFGMHVTVDDIGGADGISYSVRNSEGKLIDASSIGGGVDDTGWNLTVPFVAAAGTVLLSAGGFIWIALHSGKPRREKRK